MVKTLLVTAGAAQDLGAASSFLPLGTGKLNFGDTEANTQVTYRTAGTISNLYFNCTVHSGGHTGVITVRDTGVNTSVTATAGSNTTGIFQDTTHTATVTAADKFGYAITSNASDSFQLTSLGVTFDTSGSDSCSKLIVTTPAGFNITTASVSRFNVIAGEPIGTNGTEANAKTRMKQAGTLKNMSMFVISNARTTTTTVRGRKGGADGTLTVSIGSTATGVFEDTTHSDSIAIDDDINSNIATGTGTSTLKFGYIGFEFNVSSSSVGSLVNGITNGATVNANLTRYFPIAGVLGAGTTEADWKYRVRTGMTFSNLIINVTANTVSATSTLRFRKNGANGNQTVSITSNTSGLYQDTTNVDSLVDGDDANVSLVTGATGTSLTARFIALNTATSTTYSVSPSDTITLSESNSRVLTSIRSPSDTKTLSESTARHLSLARAISDTKTLSESTTRSRILVPRTPSDTTSLSESILRRLTAIRSLTDTKTLSESLTRTLTLQRLLSDTKTLSESIVRTLRNIRTLSDTKSASESIARALFLKRLPSDTITLSESTTGIRILPRTASDTTSLSESLARHLLLLRSPSDTTTLSESVIRLLLLLRLKTDTTTLSESLARTLILSRSIVDTKTLSESIATQRTVPISISDTISLSDSIARHLLLKRQPSDTISTSDQLIRILLNTRLLSDSTSLSESNARHLLLSRAISDTKTLSESISRLLTSIRLLSDTKTLSESIDSTIIPVGAGTIQRTPSDTVTLSESTARILLAIRTIRRAP